MISDIELVMGGSVQRQNSDSSVSQAQSSDMTLMQNINNEIISLYAYLEKHKVSSLYLSDFYHIAIGNSPFTPLS